MRTNSFLVVLFAVVSSVFLVGAQDDLKIEVTLAVGCDRKTHNGDKIAVNYRGTLTNGTEFDSSMGITKDSMFALM